MRKRLLLLALLCLLGLSFAACEEATPAMVFAFSGENAQMGIHNGLVTVAEGKTLFLGGTLETKFDLPPGVIQCTYEHFYVKDGEKETVFVLTDEESGTDGMTQLQESMGSSEGEALFGLENADLETMFGSLQFSLRANTAGGSAFEDTLPLPAKQLEMEDKTITEIYRFYGKDESLSLQDGFILLAGEETKIYFGNLTTLFAPRELERWSMSLRANAEARIPIVEEDFSQSSHVSDSNPRDLGVSASTGRMLPGEGLTTLDFLLEGEGEGAFSYALPLTVEKVDLKKAE